VAALLGLLVLAAGGSGEDWPQFLGPERDGSSRERDVVERWLKAGLVRSWSAPLGPGYSGVVTRGAALFTMDSAGGDEFVVSLDARDGRERWRQRTGPSPADVYGGLGPRVTPAVDAELVITVSAAGGLLALEADSGRLVWRRDLARDLGWRPPAEGAASSPIVSDGQIYLMNGGPGSTVAAFARNTGATSWTAVEDSVSYSSAIRWDGAGRSQVLFLAGRALYSLDPASGAELWSYAWPTHDRVNAATPLPCGPDRLFVSSGYDQGAALLRVRRAGPDRLEVEEVWRNREMKNHFNNSVCFGDTLFGFDEETLKALDAASGARLWRERGLGKGSLVRVGEHLVVLSDAGELVLARGRRDGFVVEARVEALGGTTWTPPSIAGGAIYLRGRSEVVRLAPPGPP
jgi:outer membrane protein assembly factor BamB